MEPTLNFIADAVSKFNTLLPQTMGIWGKMNAQQTVEHLADFFKLSIGEIEFPLSVPEEHLPKMKEFLYSEKMFRENTKAPLNVMPEEPVAEKQPSYEAAIFALESAIHNFTVHFEENETTTTLHPAFGWLNREGWILLHYKHIHHHLRQFNLI
jgi:oxepin-CoA hydrolase/3-oxo-5,6-dehydrosuberyl-CoA semialdehyde dehydrogenase